MRESCHEARVAARSVAAGGGLRARLSAATKSFAVASLHGCRTPSHLPHPDEVAPRALEALVVAFVVAYSRSSHHRAVRRGRTWTVRALRAVRRCISFRGLDLIQQFRAELRGELLVARGVHLDFIGLGKPVENGLIESFNGRLRDECLNVTEFTSLEHARTTLYAWRTDQLRAKPGLSALNRRVRSSVLEDGSGVARMLDHDPCRLIEHGARERQRREPRRLRIVGQRLAGNPHFGPAKCALYLEPMLVVRCGGIGGQHDFGRLEADAGEGDRGRHIGVLRVLPCGFARATGEELDALRNKSSCRRRSAGVPRQAFDGLRETYRTRSSPASLALASRSIPVLRKYSNLLGPDPVGTGVAPTLARL